VNVVSAVPPAPAGLAVFDMDGTLLPGTTACQQIALAAGDPETVATLELSYRRGLIDSTTFAQRALASWAAATDDLYQRAFDACPKIGGLTRTLRSLRDRSFVTCLVTMAPRQFAECFAAFDHIYASTYPTRILDPADKPVIVRELQNRLGIDDARTIAFGDSDSDIPLFSALSRTVAVNPTPNLEAVAAHVYRGDDLYEALRAVEVEFAASDAPTPDGVVA
jgi:phosphoserine phosphatase